MAPFARIDVQYPDKRVEVFQLSETLTTFGRAADNSIVLADVDVAGRHFRLENVDGNCLLTNLDPIMGTIVSGERIRDQQPRQLPATADIRVGGIKISFEQSSNQPTIPMRTVSDRTEPINIGFSVRLDRSTLDVFPASSSSVEIAITNSSGFERQFSIEATGLPERWIKLSQNVARLDNNDTALIMLTIVPDRRANIPPSEHRATISVSPADEPLRSFQNEIVVRLHGFGGLSLALDPDSVSNAGSLRLYLLNQGNEDLRLRLREHDPLDELRIELAERSIQLSAGQRQQIGTRVKARQRHLTGKPRLIPFALLAQAENASAYLVALPGTVRVEPRVSYRVLIFAAAVILAAALAFLSVLSRTPPPEISWFELSAVQVARGTPVKMVWRAESAHRYVVEVDRVAVAELPRETELYILDTSEYTDPVEIALIAIAGERSDIDTLQLDIFQPVTVEQFAADRRELHRNVRGALTLTWLVLGAVTIDVEYPGDFEILNETSADLGQGTLQLRGRPQTNFEIVLVAVGENDTVVERRIPIRTSDPECKPIRDTLILAGPDSGFQQIAVAIADVPVLVNGVTAYRDWLRVELASGQTGWGILGNFFCEGFDPEALTVIRDLPVPPTASPTATYTPAATPSPTSSVSANIVPFTADA